jgi:hypothetical protein
MPSLYYTIASMLLCVLIIMNEFFDGYKEQKNRPKISRNLKYIAHLSSYEMKDLSRNLLDSRFVEGHLYFRGEVGGDLSRRRGLTVLISSGTEASLYS